MVEMPKPFELREATENLVKKGDEKASEKVVKCGMWGLRSSDTLSDLMRGLSITGVWVTRSKTNIC